MLHMKYQMKRMLRQKSLLFWSVLFPLLLGMLFYLMFSGIDDLEQFSEVPVGIIGGQEQTEFLDVMTAMEVKDGISMFQVKEYKNEDEAKKALEQGKIDGYIDAEDDFRLTVKDSNTSNSLIKTFLDQYKQNVKLFTDVAKEHPERIADMVQTMESGSAVQVKEISLKGSDKSPYTQYFYALIAMTCLIGTMSGLEVGMNIQADLSKLGARRNVASTPKMKQVLRDFGGAYVLYCIIIAIVLVFCVFVYKQDFGNNAGLVLLGGCTGSFTGMAIGIMIAVLVKGTKQKKEGICSAVFLGSSFLGGLQWGTITYLLEQKCPIVNRINPATLIVNGFKSLSVFGDYRQYAMNMITLFAIGFICFFISIWKLRRAKYASL